MEPDLNQLAARVGEFISHSQARPKELPAAAFEALALELFRFQFEYNAPYQAYCRSLRALPERVSKLEHVPAIVTSAFKEFDLTVLPPGNRTAVFHSSGTTEARPSRHFHNAVTLGVYERSLLTWFEACVGMAPAKSFLFLTPPPQEVPHSSLVHMFGTLASRSAKEYCFAAESHPSGWQLRFDKIEEFLAQVRRTNSPTVVFGTAFSFVHLWDHLQAGKIALPLPPGSRVFETGGYKGRSRTVAKSELRRMIGQLFGIPDSEIVSEYGMSELSSQAYDCVQGVGRGQYLFPPWTRWEVIDPETGRPCAEGKPGLLRIYDLATVGSVLAIQTEDLAVRRADGFELIGRAAAVETRGCSLMNAA